MFLELAHTKKDIFLTSQRMVLECYRVTKNFPSEERFAMVQQIRRAALSVHLNVAEGCSRKSPTERRRYFEVSRGSMVEVDAALGIAFELKYFNSEEVQELGSLIVSSFKQLTGLIGKE